MLETLSVCLRDVSGNPSSIHKEGQRARRVLEEARESVAALIHASARELVFTSGGTESNNAAIYGSVLSGTGSYSVVTSAIEHPSVLGPVGDLERRGHSVTLVRCDARGVVDAAEVIAAIRPDTRLVTLMLANNETGALQPVAAVGRFCREKGIHFHCDAVQGAGRIAIDVEELHADTLAISAHKMHGPKGVGALYVRRGVVLDPLLQGGAQERRRRAGTENAPLAAAFGHAARIAVDEMADMARVAALRDAFEGQVSAKTACVVNGRGATRIPNTSSVRFPGSDGEGIVISLDLAGVAASTGSACSSGRVEASHVLIAMGLSEEDAKSSVRFSLSRFTTAEEIETAVNLIAGIVPKHHRNPSHGVDAHV